MNANEKVVLLQAAYLIRTLAAKLEVAAKAGGVDVDKELFWLAQTIPNKLDEVRERED